MCLLGCLFLLLAAFAPFDGALRLLCGWLGILIVATWWMGGQAR